MIAFRQSIVQIGVEPMLTDSKSIALPLGYNPMNVGRRIRTYSGISHWSYGPVHLSNCVVPTNNKWFEIDSNYQHMTLQAIALPLELPNQ